MSGENPALTSPVLTSPEMQGWQVMNTTQSPFQKDQGRYGDRQGLADDKTSGKVKMTYSTFWEENSSNPSKLHPYLYISFSQVEKSPKREEKGWKMRNCQVL